MPLVRKNSQSASFWFQCASVDSFNPPAASLASSWLMGRCSVTPIAHLVFGRLAVARHRSRDPVRGPFDLLRRVNQRQAEQFHRLRGGGEPGGRSFLADENGLAAEQLAEFLCQIANAEDLVAADI